MSSPHQTINPWTWQDQFRFSQAIVTAPPSRWVFCAGQASASPDGAILHPDDIGAQLNQSFDNLEIVLEQAGSNLSQVVRLNYYTTDVDAFFGAYDLILERLAGAGCRPASTLLGVTRLAFPELLIEIEATAVK